MKESENCTGLVPTRNPRIIPNQIISYSRVYMSGVPRTQSEVLQSLVQGGRRMLLFKAHLTIFSWNSVKFTNKI